MLRRGPAMIVPPLTPRCLSGGKSRKATCRRARFELLRKDYPVDDIAETVLEYCESYFLTGKKSEAEFAPWAEIDGFGVSDG